MIGLPELCKTEYTANELKSIKLELLKLALSKNENFTSEVINNWIETFAELRITFFEVIKRIRLAKLSQKYGVTDFGIFMNVNLSEYSDYYKHERKESNYTDPEIDKLNAEIKIKLISETQTN